MEVVLKVRFWDRKKKDFSFKNFLRVVCDYMPYVLAVVVFVAMMAFIVKIS